MAFQILTTLQAYNAAFNVDAGQCGYAAFGDNLDSWANFCNANFNVVNQMLNLGDAQLLIGHSLNGYPQSRAISGDIALGNTGVTTIQPGVVTGAKIASATITDSNITPATITDASIAAATITGAKVASATIDTGNLTTNARSENATSWDLLPLNATQAGLYITYFPRAATLLSLTLIYYAASNATPSTINVGKPGNSTYFVATTSTNASTAQWSTQTLTLANTAIAAGDVMLADITAGSGATGQTILAVEYEVN